MFSWLLHSKKGYTLIEIFIVITVLGILTAIAVPVYNFNALKHKRKDCLSQCKVIEATIQEAMYGMMDNGKRQYKIDIGSIDPSFSETVPVGNEKNGIAGRFTSVNAVRFYTDTKNRTLTLGELRGGYRADPEQEYSDGCKVTTGKTCLKRKKLENVLLQSYLANGELPVCPISGKCNYVVTDLGRVYCMDCQADYKKIADETSTAS